MGNIYVGTSKLKNLYVDTSKVKKIYKDTAMIWQSAIPIARPTSAQLNPSGTYTGSSISNGFSMTGVEYVRGSTSGTNAGAYVAYYRPDEEHIWADTEDRAEVAVTLTINPMLLTIPSLTGTTKNYTGSALTVVVNDFNSTRETQSGTVTATEGGTYTVTWTLKNTTNTHWSDNTTAAKSATWKIQWVWDKCVADPVYAVSQTTTSIYQNPQTVVSGTDFKYTRRGSSYTLDTSTGKFSIGSGANISLTSTSTQLGTGASGLWKYYAHPRTTAEGQANEFKKVYTHTVNHTAYGKTTEISISGYDGMNQCKFYKISSVIGSYSKGEHITYVGSTQSGTLYPENGVHTDGYYYKKTW